MKTLLPSQKIVEFLGKKHPLDIGVFFWDIPATYPAGYAKAIAQGSFVERPRNFAVFVHGSSCSKLAIVHA